MAEVDKKIDQFLSRIGQIESAGGKYTDHPVMQSGMHKGQHAIGTYALMPKTIDEVATRSGDDELAKLVNMDDDEKQAAIQSNPMLEKKLARTLAQHVLNNNKGDEQMAAYAWLNGHNLTPDKITKRDYLNSDYVQKYSKLAHLIHGDKRQLSSSMNQGGSDLALDPTSPEAQKLTEYMGGAGGVGSTLALNAGYKQQLADSLSNEGLKLPSSEGVQDFAMSKLITPTQAPIEEPEQAKAPITVKVPDAPQNDLPKFGSINQLISQYRYGRK